MCVAVAQIGEEEDRRVRQRYRVREEMRADSVRADIVSSDKQSSGTVDVSKREGREVYTVQ